MDKCFRKGILFLILVWCLGCGHKQRPDQEEYAAVKAALSDFMRDWGIQGPAIRPSECRLVDHFRSVDKYEMETLRKEISPELAPLVAQLKNKRADASLPDLIATCRLAHVEGSMRDPWKQLRMNPSGGVGILQVSRVGIDSEKRTALLVLNESRSDLAGTTYAIILHKANSHWSVSDRLVLARS